MKDKITVNRLAVYAYHGLHYEESKLGQRFYISLVAHLDTSEAGRTNDLGKSIDYGHMSEIAANVATNSRYQLIEALAEAIASRILDELPLVDAITVKVEKPSAPVPLVIDGVSVEITRARAHG